MSGDLLYSRGDLSVPGGNLMDWVGRFSLKSGETPSVLQSETYDLIPL